MFNIPKNSPNTLNSLNVWSRHDLTLSQVGFNVSFACFLNRINIYVELRSKSFKPFKRQIFDFGERKIYWRQTAHRPFVPV